MSRKERKEIEDQDALDLINSLLDRKCYISQSDRYIESMQRAIELLSRAQKPWVGSKRFDPLRNFPTEEDVLRTVEGLMRERERSRQLSGRLGLGGLDLPDDSQNS